MIYCLHIGEASAEKIAMPQPLYEDGVEYTDGTVATPEQMAHDVTMFLSWVLKMLLAIWILKLLEQEMSLLHCN